MINSYFAQIEKKKSIRYSWCKWLALFLTSMINFGMNYCLDNPQALQDTLEKTYDIGNQDFNLLYTAFAIPNVFMPLFGGIIIDTIGVRKGAFIFTLVPIAGQGIIVLASRIKSFGLMIAGRIVFGIGGDTIYVAQAAFISKWFSEAQFSMALATAVGISMAGSSINSMTSPWILDKFNGNLDWPLFVGFLVCVASFVFTLALILLDYRADQQEERFVFIKRREPEKFSFKDLKYLDLIYFMVMIQVVILDASFYSFMANSNNLLVSRFGFTQTDAGKVVSIIFLLGVIECPLIGWYADKYGNRVYMIFLGTGLFAAANAFIILMEGTSPGHPHYLVILPFIAISLYQAIYSAVLWASISLVVEDNVIASAYGLAQSLANLFAAVLPLILGATHDASPFNQNGYFWPEVILGVLGLFTLIFSGFLYAEDSLTGRRLQLKGSEDLDIEIVPMSPASAGAQRYAAAAIRHHLAHRFKKQHIESPFSVNMPKNSNNQD